MNTRVGLGKYEEVDGQLFKQIWWLIIIAFILVLNMPVPVTLAVAADSPNLVGKWKGTREVTVVGRGRIVNQRMNVPVDLEITEVAEDGAAFKGTLTLYPVQSGSPTVVRLNGQIENGVLKAKLGDEARLELSSRGDALSGKIIRGEHDSDEMNLKRVDSSPTK